MNSENLRKAIVDHLSKKTNYEADIDDYTIDILIENLEFAREAVKDLKRNGIVVTLNNGNGLPTTKVNPALNAYQSSIKMTKDAAQTLGINRQDRIKLKIEESNQLSDLEKLKNLY